MNKKEILSHIQSELTKLELETYDDYDNFPDMPSVINAKSYTNVRLRSMGLDTVGLKEFKA